MKKVSIIDILAKKFGIKKLHGCACSSKGRMGFFVDGKFCTFNAEANMLLPTIGKRTGKPVTFKYEDVFGMPANPTDITKGKIINTVKGPGIFLSYDQNMKVITMLTFNNEIVEVCPEFDAYYNKFVVEKIVPLYELGKKPNQYEYWTKGKGRKLRNEIMLDVLGISKDHALYDFLLNSLTVSMFAANCQTFNPKFTNTLAVDIARPSMIVLVANGKLNEVLNYSLAAKVYDVPMDAFEGDRAYFEKHQIPVTDGMLDDFINKELIKEFVGEEPELDAAETADEAVEAEEADAE